MTQLVYKDKIYLWGNIREVVAALKALESKYKTVQQLLESYRVQMQ